METKIFDTMSNNNSFGQCKYNSNALQDISTDSATAFGEFFSIYNLQQCRLCTVQYPIIMLTSIFDNQCVNRYLKMLEICLPVKMHKNDGLPHYICCSCFMKLEQCYEWLNKFRNAYNTHREEILLTDEQTQIDSTSINTVPVSSETKSNESNNIDINIQNDNQIEANPQYTCPVCSKLLPSENDLISHNLSEHLLFESEMNIKKQADTYVQKKVAENLEKQSRNKDENIQNNGQCLDVVVGSTDSENDGQVNNFSAETSSRECMSVNTDTADVCSVKSTEADSRLDNDPLMSTAGMGVSKIRLKKTNELTYNAESYKFQVQHRENSPTFSVNIVTKENTSSAAPLRVLTNNDKIELIYECSFCNRWITSKKKLAEHCIAVHKMSKDEKITCRQLTTIVTGDDIESSHYLQSNDENIGTDNTDVNTKDSESHQYAYECSECSKQLSTKEDLISHCVANKCLNAQNQIVCKQVKLKSMSTVIRYQCKRCDASFTKPRDRIIHMLGCRSKKNTAKASNVVEPGEVRYQCKQCDASFATPQGRIIHMSWCQSKESKAKDTIQVQPDQVRYECKQCDAFFARPQARIIHTLKCHSEEGKAKDMNKVQPDDKTARRLVREHFKLSMSSNSCLCMYCGAIRTKMSLIQHERIHTDERPYQCAVCLKTFRTAAALASHKEIHNNCRKYICHRCGRACNTQKRLWAHMKTHLSMAERPFVCEVCGKRFGRSDHYKRHKDGHAEIVASQVLRMNKDVSDSPIEYKCLMCDKEFKTGVRLKIHMKRVHVNKQYNCHECGKTFNTRYKLTIHRYLHTGEKPYKCNFCGKAFRCRSTRYQHTLDHKLDASYSCDICGKRFKRPGHLILHKQSHSSDKSYICNVCGKAFLRQRDLSDHQKGHKDDELKTEVVVSDKLGMLLSSSKIRDKTNLSES